MPFWGEGKGYPQEASGQRTGPLTLLRLQAWLPYLRGLCQRGRPAAGSAPRRGGPRRMQLGSVLLRKYCWLGDPFRVLGRGRRAQGAFSGPGSCWSPRPAIGTSLQATRASGDGGVWECPSCGRCWPPLSRDSSLESRAGSVDAVPRGRIFAPHLLSPPSPAGPCPPCWPAPSCRIA